MWSPWLKSLSPPTCVPWEQAPSHAAPPSLLPSHYGPGCSCSQSQTTCCSGYTSLRASFLNLSPLPAIPQLSLVTRLLARPSSPMARELPGPGLLLRPAALIRGPFVLQGLEHQTPRGGEKVGHRSVRAKSSRSASQTCWAGAGWGYRPRPFPYSAGATPGFLGGVTWNRKSRHRGWTLRLGQHLKEGGSWPQPDRTYSCTPHPHPIHSAPS